MSTDAVQVPEFDAFLSHLIALLSVYEIQPVTTPVPRYDGPRDWYKDTILHSLAVMARRMYSAEEAIRLNR
ncbi:hypothetical protein DFH11DRAFT_1521137, partial [Phellopilus nigrolimitatus]